MENKISTALFFFTTTRLRRKSEKVVRIGLYWCNRNHPGISRVKKIKMSVYSFNTRTVKSYASRVSISVVMQLHNRLKLVINCCSAYLAPTTRSRALGLWSAGRAKRSHRPRCSETVLRRWSWDGTWADRRTCDSGTPCRPGTPTLRARRTCPTRTSSPWSARSTWRHPVPRTASCNLPRTPWPRRNRTVAAPPWFRLSRCC